MFCPNGRGEEEVCRVGFVGELVSDWLGEFVSDWVMSTNVKKSELYQTKSNQFKLYQTLDMKL